MQWKAGSIRRFVSIVIGGRLHGKEALTLDIQPPPLHDRKWAVLYTMLPL